HGHKYKLKAPITPSSKFIKVKDDHPLWQFFHNKKYQRSTGELDQTGRPWTVPELRRKDFNDLHSLWYTCLKERNILAREHYLYKNDFRSDVDLFEKASEDIRTTMWRIRYVLGERQKLFENAQGNFESGNKNSNDNGDKNSSFVGNEEGTTELYNQLTRLNEALFDIKSNVFENSANENLLEGILFNANFKLKKF
ncbi:mitochondrial 54S ribosomal protein uL29m, partial [Ascoidea rubescens DSM 1968]